VRRRGRPVALLTPRRPPRRVARPDFLARLRGIYGNRVLSRTGTDVVSEARGES
jgi:antitoxin (DNA-binding transcriptional repressor) of toxin-antitoxin stability system